MTEDEVQEIVSGAVDVTESNPDEALPIKRAQMANWLWSKFRIAIRELVVSINDGEPYLVVEYIGAGFEDGEPTTQVTHVSMAKYREKLTKELEKMTESIKNAEN